MVLYRSRCIKIHIIFPPLEARGRRREGVGGVERGSLIYRVNYVAPFLVAPVRANKNDRYDRLNKDRISRPPILKAPRRVGYRGEGRGKDFDRGSATHHAVRVSQLVSEQSPLLTLLSRNETQPVIPPSYPADLAGDEIEALETKPSWLKVRARALEFALSE